jgi:hypothetical protein
MRFFQPVKIPFPLLGLVLPAAVLFAADPSTPAPKPEVPLRKPYFQNDFFGEMPRAFCIIQKIDLQAKTMVVKVLKDGRLETISIGPDTELLFRNAYGELEDYFPGQHVMLFVYGDEDRKWAGIRAVQDEIQMTAQHNWFGTITKIDREKRQYWTRREEKNDKKEVTKVVELDHIYAPDVKVWKGETPVGADALQVGDEVIQQLVEKDGQLVAVEMFDRAGADAVRKIQEARLYQSQTERGLSGYVLDLEPMSGALTVMINRGNLKRAGELKVGDEIKIAPADGSAPFAGAIYEIKSPDSRKRLELLVNSRAAARLKYGEPLRVFMPGTGGPLPEGRSGIPTPPVKK